MGVYDNLHCEMPLPETGAPAPTKVFQTKDTPSQYQTDYWITKEGALMWRPFEMKPVPPEERDPPGSPYGAFRRAKREPEIVDYTGELRFYTGGFPDGGWWEYEAMLMNGQVQGIAVAEFRPPSPAVTPYWIVNESGVNIEVRGEIGSDGGHYVRTDPAVAERIDGDGFVSGAFDVHTAPYEAETACDALDP